MNERFQNIFHLLFFEDKAGNVKGVEEEVANDISRLRTGQFKAGAKPLIAGAMHDGVDSTIGQAEFSFPRLNADWASQVMMSAASVCSRISSH